jgi:hypothetical protein
LPTRALADISLGSSAIASNDATIPDRSAE